MGKLIKLPMIIKTFGDSMYPLLIDGDVLYLKRINFSQTKVNDIITVKNSTKYFTHRIIYKGKDYLITKGDGNHFFDKKVLPKNVIGIVKKVKRQNIILNTEQIYLLQSTVYFKEIIKIKKILEKNKIEIVFLKGLPLHLYYEETHPKRIYADCDILIYPKDFPKVKSLLKKFGYKKLEDDLSDYHKKLKGKDSEISFIKVLNGFHVVFDIHFEIVFMMTQLGELNHLYPQRKIYQLSKEFMEDKKIINIMGESFPILSTTNLIIYLCLHLFHHNFKGAYRLELISKIIGKGKIDYSEMKLTVKKYNLQNFIFPCFLLLNKYYKTKIDEKFLNEIKPDKKALSYIKKEVLNSDIFNEEERIGSGVKRFKMIFFLSPNPLFKKLFVFLNSEVIYSVLWVFYKRLNPSKT